MREREREREGGGRTALCHDNTCGESLPVGENWMDFIRISGRVLLELKSPAITEDTTSHALQSTSYVNTCNQ